MIPYVRDMAFDYGRPDQVSPLIRRVVANNPGPFTFRGTGTYIVGHGEVAVIDPGPDLPEHLDAILAATAGERIAHILTTHTHADHSPLAHPLARATGATIHGLPAPGADTGPNTGEEPDDALFRPDVTLKDGDRVSGPGWTLETLTTPGHASNHLAFTLAEENALFCGDHVMGWSTTVIAPPDGNMGDYLASLEKLIGRGDAILYPTHGAPITAPENFLHAYLVHRRMREAQIGACVVQGYETIPDIVAKLYAGLSPALGTAAALTVQAHLEHLMENGKVARQGDHYLPIAP